MPGPGVLIPTAAAFGCAAALGVGIFIGLNWDTIKDTAQSIIEENKMLWEDVQVDLSMYNGPNSSEDEDQDERENNKRSEKTPYQYPDAQEPSKNSEEIPKQAVTSLTSDDPSANGLRHRSVDTLFSNSSSDDDDLDIYEKKTASFSTREFTSYDAIPDRTPSSSTSSSELPSRENTPTQDTSDDASVLSMPSDEFSSFEEVDYDSARHQSSPDIL